MFETVASSNRSDLSFLQNSDDGTSHAKVEMYQTVDNVRIIPQKLIFQDAFDGKIFNRSFTVINCGKYPAFVRVFSPRSKIFKMKPLPKGVYLPSGLSITRTISYTHKSAMVLPQTCLFIYINGKSVIYQIEVHLISPFVSLMPKTLDFGEVDVGNASKQMLINLINSGHKVAPFIVDLGRNDLEIIVEPMKGTIEPNNSVEMTVEVLGSQLGTFSKEFWIKTEPPQRVNLGGIFIPARLVVEYPFTAFDHLKVVGFPITYYGAKSIKTLVILNSSSTSSMFCTVVECGMDFEYLDAAKKTNPNLKNFFVKPKEGRLHAQQKYILHYSFAPKKVKSFNSKYSIAFIKIMKIDYRDGIVVAKDVEVKTFPNTMDLEQYSVASLQSVRDFFAEIKGIETFIRICLYGEMEDASVKLTPDSFYLNYLRVNESYNYELNIQNNSKHLPILIKYNKETCIEMDPKEVLLGPNASTEVTIIIKPIKPGESSYNVILDLVHHSGDEYYKVGTTYLQVKYLASLTPPKVEPKFNMGITPKITHEVGFLVDDVRFNSNIDKPRQAVVSKHFKNFNKNNQALVAFPNDRPRSLRPWKNTDPVRTIYASIPRLVTLEDSYTLNAAEFDRKQYTRNVYSTYVQSRANARRVMPTDPSPDYTIDDKQLLLEKVPSTKFNKYELTCTLNKYHIPLPPERLMRVRVRPKYVRLGKIAPYTSCTNFFTIENENDFSIAVSIKALNNSVVIKEKKRMTIGALATKNIFFDCYSHGLGRYYVPVFIIVNDCHIFDATVFAKVVPTTVKCHFKEIVIDPKINENFFEIFNPVNCDITFDWEVQDKNFDVVPKSGTIPSRKGIYCRILFLPQIEAIFKTEIYLISQSGAKQVIKVSVENEKASVGFSTYLVKFDNISLNIPIKRDLVLRNFSDVKIMYLVVNPHPLEEISIEPIEGEICGKSDVQFLVTANFQNVVDFNCSIRFLLQDVYTFIVNIAGNVVYPTIKMEPDYIQIHKITSGAAIRRVFRVTNISEAQSFINFPLEDIPEFFITDKDKNIINKVVALEPNESEELFLEFKPAEPIAYSIFLPCIINGIIGPPALNDPVSLRPSNYFKEQSSDSKFTTAVELPETLSTISIRCAAGQPMVKFSSLHLHMFSFSSKSRKDFKIINISATSQCVSIPLVDPECPFTFKIEKGSDYKINEHFHEVVIKPEEIAAFKIEFKPSEYGSFDVELPIFVEKYYANCPFNYLKLSAIHPKPIITCDVNSICFYTIWVTDNVSQRITLNKFNHTEDCTIIIKIDNAALSFRKFETIIVTKYHSKVDYLIRFNPKEECFVDYEIIFTCTCCDSTCSLFVKASADNSTFISYQSLLMFQGPLYSQTVESTFPYFPCTSNDSFYAHRLRTIQMNIERWLFSQGYYFKSFYKIPSGMASFPVDIQPKSSKMKKNTKKSVAILPLMQLLVNFVDIAIVKLFDDGNVTPTYEGIEGTLYVYTIYRNIISFLKSQGAFVPQLKPEHLLPYYNYVAFKERLVDEDIKYQEPIFSKADFYLFSKQCWIDLILRIYKIFVFNRILNPMVPRVKSKLPPKQIVYKEEFQQYVSEHLSDISNHCENEAIMLLWLEFHFNKQKYALWDCEHLKEHRKITSFQSHLWDSLPFATLMLSYCPYMRNELENFYPDYQNDEQIFHNACVISETWKKINLSFNIPPSSIVKPTTYEMLLLVSYLYDVLPNFYPTETITFEASLGETAVSDIILKNQGNVTISYSAIFFSNDTDIFQVESKTITIPPKKEKTVKVIYQAKNILKKTAVLVLSGETAGYKFSKSMAITLIGIPRVFNFTEEYVIKIETFQKTKKKFAISSPYETAYAANVCLYIVDQTDTDQFVHISTITEQKVPMQMNIEPVINFDQDGDANLNLSLCYLITGTYTYFLYFVNEEVGDFCIKIHLESDLDKDTTLPIEIDLPPYFDQTAACTCGNCTCAKGIMNVNCPQIVSIEIPCRNSQLFAGLKSMLGNICDEVEYNFWTHLLDETRGLHIFRNYTRNTFGGNIVRYSNVLKPTVTYDVVGSSTNFLGPEKITLDNVSSDETYPLKVHWNSKLLPEEERVTLTAEHGQEIRQYKLIFKSHDS